MHVTLNIPIPRLHILLFLLTLLANALPAQDTIYFRGDTIRVGELEWDMEKDWQSKADLLSENPELYGDHIKILLRYHPNKMVEAITFGYLAPDTGFIPHGPARYYYDSGHLLAKRTHYLGQLQGPALDFHKNGTLRLNATYRNDTLHGPFLSYFEDGKPAQAATYSHGQLTGRYQAWYSNGQPKWTEHWSQGTKTGPDTAYYETGTIESIFTYSQGQVDGPATFYHRNARPWSERIYLMGKLQQVSFIKSKEGLPLEIGTFKDGNGWLYIYNDDGLPIEQERYKHGLLRKVKSLKRGSKPS